MAYTFSFEEAIFYLQDIGAFDYVLPFLLIFSIVFAALEKTKIFGNNKTNINAVVGLVVGLILVVQQDIVAIINLFLPRVSLILVVILMILLLISVVAGSEWYGLRGTLFSIAIIIIIIAVIIAVSTPIGYGPSWLTSSEVEALLRVAIPIGILLAIIYLVTRTSRGNREGAQGQNEEEDTFLNALNRHVAGSYRRPKRGTNPPG